MRLVHRPLCRALSIDCWMSVIYLLAEFTMPNRQKASAVGRSDMLSRIMWSRRASVPLCLNVNIRSANCPVIPRARLTQLLLMAMSYCCFSALFIISFHRSCLTIESCHSISYTNGSKPLFTAKIPAMTIADTCNAKCRYLRWLPQVSAFFQGLNHAAKAMAMGVSNTTYCITGAISGMR